ncbi:8-amino-7-oxononanoate synthase [Arenicella xantha]|uniref:8-amino-7-oxononanoate synthase n=1 Tax=Arenicella xantha TaxID=644221 RepID=A0A395JNE5_9GAMM|nr:8-amino-7-oxononanoate synthase [Arenicella xantha]RBP53089.1 8-amino-7-oxononanoate synthase [Arenicella xantha]
MQHTWRADLAAQHHSRRASNHWRERIDVGSAQSTKVIVGGRSVLNFSSNDYLGLASHPQLGRAAADAVAQWGAGSGASHLVCGHLDLHSTLEREIAEFVGAERALLFSNGYMANLGICAAFAEKRDAIVQDKLNHASLIDGGRLSLAHSYRYRHLSVSHAAAILQRSEAARHLIVSDGVFSMDGDVAPLTNLSALADAYNGLLIVDDAHGFGVLGDQGRGTLNEQGLRPRGNVLLMATLGKALGSFGAFVAGDALLIDHLLQTARSYIYTTALPPSAVSASLAGLHLIKEAGSDLQIRLRKNIDYLRAAAAELGLNFESSNTAIQPIIIGAPQRALEVSERLRRDGVWVVAIRPPTVPVGSSRLRVTLSANHTFNDIDVLLQSLMVALGEAQ